MECRFDIYNPMNAGQLCKCPEDGCRILFLKCLMGIRSLPIHPQHIFHPLDYTDLSVGTRDTDSLNNFPVGREYDLRVQG